MVMFTLNDLKIMGRFWFLYTVTKNTTLLVLPVAYTTPNFNLRNDDPKKGYSGQFWILLSGEGSCYLESC